MARKSDDTTRRPGERVAKVMARAGLGSRREAEEWIAAGRVAVNGVVITTPAVNVPPQDKVTVDGKPLPARERTRLFLYHKPRGLITTRKDPQGRKTIFEVLPQTLPRLISIGRLDLGTEGLLLLTNDGGLARILELPETGWLRRYRVRAHGRVTQPQLDALRDGVEVEGIQYGPIEATLDREQASNVWLTFAIREGKNREVRNVLGHLGLQVARLIRVSYGPFQLGELPEGAVEEVPTRVLRDQLGERVARLAGVDFAAPVIVREAPAAPEPVRSRADQWPEHPAGKERRPRETLARDGRRGREERAPPASGPGAVTAGRATGRAAAHSPSPARARKDPDPGSARSRARAISAAGAISATSAARARPGRPGSPTSPGASRAGRCAASIAGRGTARPEAEAKAEGRRAPSAPASSRTARDAGCWSSAWANRCRSQPPKREGRPRPPKREDGKSRPPRREDGRLRPPAREDGKARPPKRDGKPRPGGGSKGRPRDRAPGPRPPRPRTR
ncbi:MAG: pseudouridine synthase [Xanthobacteraceae bacterium]|nr:pseudouridine synthase [Xanthobacteraceae bacterium]